MHATKLFGLLAVGLVSAAPAFAEDWAGTPVPAGQGRINTLVNPTSTPKTSLYGGEGVLVGCDFGAAAFGLYSKCPNPNESHQAVIPLSAFAQASTVDQLNGRIDDLGDGVALAGALDIVLPPNGQSNRFGVTVSEVESRQAYGVSYARVQGNFDIGVSFAATGNNSGGKAGAGFSW
jgi:hypothetical protein